MKTYECCIMNEKWHDGWKVGKKWHHGWNFRENGYTMDEN